jgi:Zn-dependent M28 family amino/carboxypeptidase
VAISGLRVSIAVAMEKVSRSAHNVIAVLPGADPRLREEVIVVGAHYDHLGLGGHGSRDSAAEGRIHYGADDNASGTAVLMALAAGMSRLAEKPPRTILFAAFAGEELGLYGSRHFVAHPPVPLSAVKTMINLDMVGRMRDNQVTVSGAGSAKELQALIEETARSVGITARISPRNTGGSDHTPFRQIGIPALHFHTGLHEDYHRPTDVWEKLNVEGMVKITALVAEIVNKLARAEEPPAFAPLISPAPEA